MRKAKGKDKRKEYQVILSYLIVEQELLNEFSSQKKRNNYSKNVNELLLEFMEECTENIQ